MKYIKTFEKFKSKQEEDYLNYILDKIQKHSIDSLSELELKFLNNSSFDIENEEIIKDLEKRNTNIDNGYKYDPRKDDYMDEFDFDDYSDDEINDTRYSFFYDEIEEEDILRFFKYFKIPPSEYLNDDNKIKAYDNLTDETKSKFKKFMDEIY